jgi:AcrR family transcriptional regulator
MVKPEPEVTNELKRRRRPSEVRQLLLDSAIEIFAQRGYGGASTKEIADAAGVAESALFRHFSSKANLFIEAAVVPFTDFLTQFTADSIVGRAEQLDEATIVANLVRDIYDNMEARRGMVLALATANHPDLENLGEDIARRFELAVFKPLKDLSVARAAERGIEPRDFDLTSRAIVAMVTAMTVLEPWFLPRGRKRPSRTAIIDEMVAIALSGATIDRDRRGPLALPAASRNGGKK